MIDSHQHFWKYNPATHGWINEDMRVIRRDFQPEDLRPLLVKHGIGGCVSVQVDQTEEETLSLLALADDHDFIKGVVGWIDLRDSRLDSRLEYFSTLKKLKGFRHIVQGEKPGFLSQDSFIQGVRQLHRRGFTYDLLIYHHQLEEAYGFVKKIPDTKIVIDHLAKPSIVTGSVREWAKRMREMARLPNVFCKISGMVTEADWMRWQDADFVPYLEVMLEAFGSNRLLYGSDWPVCLVAAGYDRQFAIVQKFIQPLSVSEKKRILGENAERFYNL
jgi:L-fuconolactonase